MEPQKAQKTQKGFMASAPIKPLGIYLGISAISAFRTAEEDAEIAEMPKQMPRGREAERNFSMP
jgi:hypothetical protein